MKMTHSALLSPLLVSCILGLTACGGSGGGSNNTPPVVTPPPTLPPVVVELPALDEVVNYQLADTAQLLTDVAAQLDGLSIDNFFDMAYQITAKRNPEDIVASGQLAALPLETVGLTNISDAYNTQTAAIKSLILGKLQLFDKTSLSAANQLTYEVYEADLLYQLEAEQFRDYSYPATYGFFGWPGGTESYFTNLLPLTNQSDAEQYLDFLNQIGRRFDQIIELIDTRKAAGVIEPAVTLDFSRTAVANMAASAVTNTAYYQSFNERVSALDNITDADKQALDDKLKQIVEQRVIPAYQKLSERMAILLTEAPTNIGFGQFEGGQAYYDFALRFFTTGNKTADEVHQQGIDELARIHSQMRTRFDQLGYPQNETIAQSYARVDADAGTIPGAEAVAFYENLISETYTKLPEIFATLPQQEVAVIGGPTGGFYISGSDDGTRPGAFFAQITGTLTYTTMPTLAYHEAVPGHHLQIALANELDLPQLRRKANFTVFTEGWGLYAERLASDLGWYENDVYGDLGRLQFEAMRAARLTVDTGIHNRGWTYTQADAFHLENVGFPGAIARYSVWPGQATAYMTGMLKIIELREKAQQQLGELYDVREFHSTVIGSGSMPMNVLEQVVDRYIAGKLAARK